MKSYRPNQNLDWQENLFNYAKQHTSVVSQMIYSNEIKNNITKSIPYWHTTDRNCNIVIDYFSCYGTLDTVGKKYNLTSSRIREIIAKIIRQDIRRLLINPERIFNPNTLPFPEINTTTKIETLHGFINMGLYNTLIRGQYHTIGDVINDSIPHLLRTRNFRPIYLSYITDLLLKCGYTTRDGQTWEKI